MQIRERGKQVICIKTEYSTEKKRTFGRQVASQDKYMSTVSDEVRLLLDDADVAELEEWLNQREKDRDKRISSSQLTSCQYALKHATEALDNGGRDLSEVGGDSLWGALLELQKALTRAGYKRPKPPAKSSAKQAAKRPVDKKQTDMLS